MVDTRGLGPRGRKAVRVQISPWANFMKYATSSTEQTGALARNLAAKLKGGDIVLLQGELGSGKTTFVKELAQALGIKEKITSPTFVLMHNHKIMKALKHKNIVHFVHCDAYRIKSARELREVGLLDWLGRPDTLTVVEWGEKIKPLLKGQRYLTIKFKYGKPMNERIITVSRTNYELIANIRTKSIS